MSGVGVFLAAAMSLWRQQSPVHHVSILNEICLSLMQMSENQALVFPADNVSKNAVSSASSSWRVETALEKHCALAIMTLSVFRWATVSGVLPPTTTGTLLSLHLGWLGLSSGCGVSVSTGLATAVTRAHAAAAAAAAIGSIRSSLLTNRLKATSWFACSL